MYDESPDNIGVFDFDEFASHLLDQGVQASPSLLHGCLSGLLAAGAEVQPEYGLDAMSRSLEVDVHGELARRIMQLYTVTLESLQDDEFLFHPLLPDDDDDIALRTESLASWCRGFLTGFAYRIAARNKVGDALSPETGEVLRDITAMAEAAVDDKDRDEEAEESYMELVEYLRVAVANVFMDAYVNSQEESVISPERPLH
jgi:yecA family protein